MLIVFVVFFGHIKILDELINDLFLLFVSILKELKHVNCCYLYDYFYTTASDNPDEKYLNLIMEYMPETLYKELNSELFKTLKLL